ncbi:MAG: FtsX-like permease family protein [Bacteroidota bacterium]
MNFSYFFARRITFKQQRSVSVLMVRLAVLSIALAVAVIELSQAFVQGFETEIQNKVIGFGSHIQIGSYFSLAEEEIPLTYDTAFVEQVDTIPAVAAIAPYVTEVGVMVGPVSQTGVVLKGVDKRYDWSFFANALQEGELPNLDEDKVSLEILISRKQAQTLGLKVGDKSKIFFLKDPPRRRPVKVIGIYETGMEEFDLNIVMCDMRLVQKIRRWRNNQVSAYEVNLHSLETLEETANEIDAFSVEYEVLPITDLYPEIFDWLGLQHQNVTFIMILMITVAIINMSSVVLILIIDRTPTIGVLKALGLRNSRLQSLFVFNAFFLILAGVALGNILGLGLIWMQDQFGIVRLDQANYFVDVVPVAWVWGKFLWVNVAVIGICTLFMLIPTIVIGRITPITAIRFE